MRNGTGVQGGHMRRLKTLGVALLMIPLATGCVDRRFGACGVAGGLIGATLGAVGGGVGVDQIEHPPTQSEHIAGGAGAGAAAGALIGTLLGHVICDPEAAPPPPPPPPPLA